MLMVATAVLVPMTQEQKQNCYPHINSKQPAVDDSESAAKQMKYAEYSILLTECDGQ